MPDEKSANALSLTDAERPLLLQLLSRGCAHVGAEIAQSGSANAPAAIELLALAVKLSTALAEKK